jgi:hypothetical protein
MQPFKIRCSCIGEIMAYPEKKEVPAGAKTFIHNWIKEKLYNRTKSFSNKYTEKGTTVEDEAINFAADFYGWGLVSKNDDFLEDDFMTGTPDLILSNLVPDIKSSWDCFSFPLFTSKLDSGYEWQVQGYMNLTGKESGAVIYCLMDAPDELVEKEARMLSYKAGYSELDSDFYDEVKKTMVYSHLPNELRIKKFEVKRDEAKIQQIKDRVQICRDYIKTLSIPKTNKLVAL